MTYGIMKPEEMKTCLEMAVQAFSDYDYFSIYMKNKTRRRLFLKSMIGTEYKINAEGEVFLTAKDNGRIVSAAILCSPDYQKPDDQEYLKGGFWKAVICGGYKNVDAWNKMENKAIDPCRNQQDSWYLSMLVVDKSVEGKGMGSRMIQECIIPYVRECGGRMLCLFTNSEINRRFYVKNGFSEFDEREFSYKGKTIGSWSYKKELA